MQAPSIAPRTPIRDSVQPEHARIPAYAYAMAGLAIASIWVSVALASIFSPDMITGSQHEHLPIAAILAWLWGAIATGQVLLATLAGIRAGTERRAPWMVLGIGVTVLWLAALPVGIWAPYFVTGSDPTQIPFGAIFSPIVAMIITWMLCSFVKSIFEMEHRAS